MEEKEEKRCTHKGGLNGEYNNVELGVWKVEWWKKK